mmetsp:Transcript_74876/g.120910  ORF Transcript_74876/g.120910 Transcript_74876/m.120910 type:complete len:119 (-) Transcript_74876:43-399(-)
MPVGKHASTEISASAYLQDDCREKYSLLEGHPLVSDKRYGGQARRWCPRIFLHSWSLGLQICGETLQVDCPLPQDLRSTLAALTPCSQEARSVQQHWLAGPTRTSSASSPEEYEGSGY